jgi:hypothetical protein
MSSMLDHPCLESSINFGLISGNKHVSVIVFSKIGCGDEGTNNDQNSEEGLFVHVNRYYKNK